MYICLSGYAQFAECSSSVCRMGKSAHSRNQEPVAKLPGIFYSWFLPCILCLMHNHIYFGFLIFIVWHKDSRAVGRADCWTRDEPKGKGQSEAADCQANIDASSDISRMQSSAFRVERVWSCHSPVGFIFVFETASCYRYKEQTAALILGSSTWLILPFIVVAILERKNDKFA